MVIGGLPGRCFHSQSRVDPDHGCPRVLGESNWNAHESFSARFQCGVTGGEFMAETAGELEGPDFEKGCKINKVADSEMLLGHAFGEAVLVATRGDVLFAI